MIAWKVVVKQGDVETVYLSVNRNARDTQEDVISAFAPAKTDDLTVAARIRAMGASISATPWPEEEPCRLYAVNTKTGACEPPVHVTDAPAPAGELADVTQQLTDELAQLRKVSADLAATQAVCTALRADLSAEQDKRYAVIRERNEAEERARVAEIANRILQDAVTAADAKLAALDTGSKPH